MVVPSVGRRALVSPTTANKSNMRSFDDPTPHTPDASHPMRDIERKANVNKLKKMAHEVDYLRDLLVRHSLELDERLYYLCKNYTHRHRIQMKRRKTESRAREVLVRKRGTVSEVVCTGDGVLLLLGSNLPNLSPAWLEHPLVGGERVRIMFRPVDGDKRLWATIEGDYVDVPAGRYERLLWEEIGPAREDLTWKDRANVFFDTPSSSPAAKVYFVIQVVLIMVSIIALALETTPSYMPTLNPENSEIFFWVECIITVVFTIETLFRIFIAHNRVAFLKKPTTIADILAVLPFYIGEILREDRSDVLKICRLFRMMKFFRNFRPIEDLVRALEKSSHALLAPFVFLLACSLSTSTAMYYCERGTWDAERGKFMILSHDCQDGARANQTLFPYDPEACLIESKFRSIPQTMWWSIVTMTTIGYGDMVPVTNIGKLVGGLSMVLGVVFMAMPIAIVGSYFTVVVDDKQEAKILQREQAGGYTGAPATRQQSRAASSPTGKTHGPSAADLALHAQVSAAGVAKTKQDVKSALQGSLLGQASVGLRHVRDVEEVLKGGNDNEVVQTKGERLAEFLSVVVPEQHDLWRSSNVVHHFDLWLDANTKRSGRTFAQLSPEKRTASRDLGTGTVAPCIGNFEWMPPSGGGQGWAPPATDLWLLQEMRFTFGSRCPHLPDPDFVLTDVAASERGIHVAQRHAEVKIAKWWTDQPLVKVHPIGTNVISVNGKRVPLAGVYIAHNDVIDFCPESGGGELRYRYGADSYTRLLLNTNNVSASNGSTAATPLPPSTAGVRSMFPDRAAPSRPAEMLLDVSCNGVMNSSGADLLPHMKSSFSVIGNNKNRHGGSRASSECDGGHTPSRMKSPLLHPLLASSHSAIDL